MMKASNDFSGDGASGLMTKNKAMNIKANIEKILRKHKIWYDVEYVFRSEGLDSIRFKGISIKIDGKDLEELE